MRVLSGTRNSLIFGVVIGLVASIVFVAGFAAGTVVTRSTADSYGTSDKNLQDFLSAYRLVTQHSYYKHISHQALVYAAIDGMFAATGDPHTMFLSPTENKQAGSELNGANYGGIGAIVVPVKSGLRVLSPLQGTPASRAGLRDGDLVTAINGSPVAGMDGNAAILRIHGPAGSVVRLTIRRNGRTLTVPVTREHIAATTAYGRSLGHGLGYVQIFSFGSETPGQVRSALTQALHPGIRGLVLDLRGNPGGYVSSAQQIVSDFLSKGVVAYEKSNNGSIQPLPVLAGSKIVHVPVDVLVDGNTASAAEITAAALHDEDHAVVLGTRTYGKGSMQSVYTMSDGSSMRITDRLWLTPDKHSIQTVGIRPDITVQAGDGNSGSDPQLNAAEQNLLHRAAP